ncbi:MAG: DNA/RNA nuclease SfsA [Dehalococcoidia bacterium]|nr:DNA/RNA nuclease SfsA [Dehalococcoidia bacterium]
MRLEGQLTEGFFLERLNRFAAAVEVAGRRELAHVANSGRMHEVLLPRVPVLLRPAAHLGRKTAYDLVMVRLENQLISVDARLPSALVHEALLEGRISGLESYRNIRREVRYGAHRLDLLALPPEGLAQNGGPCLIEAKSITLVVGGCALFPDAPTLRGARHMAALLRFRQEGHKAAVVFVIQRDDARSFSPNDQADPQFGRALREASAGGVMVRAFLCKVGLEEICLDREVPVYLPLAGSPS